MTEKRELERKIAELQTALQEERRVSKAERRDGMEIFIILIKVPILKSLSAVLKCFTILHSFCALDDPPNLPKFTWLIRTGCHQGMLSFSVTCLFKSALITWRTSNKHIHYT